MSRLLPAVSLVITSVLIGVVTSGCEKLKTNLEQPSVAASPQPSPSVPKPIAAEPIAQQKATQPRTRMEVKPTTTVFYFDSSKWEQTGSPEAGRTEFRHKSGEGFAVVIAERIQLSDPVLREVALTNAKEVAADARIIHTEKRVVNGRAITQLRMKATVEGIPVEYLGYYFTGKEGTVQVITYTTQNLIGEYQQEFEEFLNGFTVEG